MMNMFYLILRIISHWVLLISGLGTGLLLSGSFIWNLNDYRITHTHARAHTHARTHTHTHTEREKCRRPFITLWVPTRLLPPSCCWLCDPVRSLLPHAKVDDQSTGWRACGRHFKKMIIKWRCKSDLGFAAGKLAGYTQWPDVIWVPGTWEYICVCVCVCVCVCSWRVYRDSIWMLNLLWGTELNSVDKMSLNRSCGGACRPPSLFLSVCLYLSLCVCFISLSLSLCVCVCARARACVLFNLLKLIQYVKLQSRHNACLLL